MTSDPPFDALIVGAGPAGCAAAFDLARAGRRVLLLDRRTFPRPKACACGLTRKTLRALRYSVDPVVERVCHEIVLQRTAAAQNSPEPAAADKNLEVRVRTRHPICAMAVRERFDDFCLGQTLAAGDVTLRKIESITALREFPTHVELDIISSQDGEQQIETLTAPVLVGADGSNGQIRRLANPGATPDPTWYTRGFALEALIPYTALPPHLPAGDAPHDLVFDFAPLPGGYGWLFPKGDHINIGVGAFAEGEPALLRTVTRKLLAQYTAQKLGVDLAALPASAVTGQHLGMGGHLYVPRGRILLTGDAAGLVDPLTGEGIHSAIVSGQAAAAAILEVLEPTARTVTDPATSHPGGPSFAVSSQRVGSNDASAATALAAAYTRHLTPLQQTLAFSHRAARAFYKQPERGFRAMRLPILRGLILKTYADGLPHIRLLTALAKLV